MDRKEYYNKRLKTALENNRCKMCLKNSVCLKSKSYCENCLEIRRKANQKYNESHRKENYIRTLDWIKRNPEKKARQVKRYKEKRKEYCAAKNKAYKQTEKYKLKAKEYREINKEKINKVSSEWQRKNPERKRKNVKNWLFRNAHKLSEYARNYQKRHPEQVTKSSRKRREIFKNIDGNFNFSEWENLCKYFENKCLYCGKFGIKLTVDHVIPISKGGSNFISNIQPLCQRCNSKKGKKILDFRPFGITILDWT